MNWPENEETIMSLTFLKKMKAPPLVVFGLDKAFAVLQQHGLQVIEHGVNHDTIVTFDNGLPTKKAIGSGHVTVFLQSAKLKIHDAVALAEKIDVVTGH